MAMDTKTRMRKVKTQKRGISACILLHFGFVAAPLTNPEHACHPYQQIQQINHANALDTHLSPVLPAPNS